MINRRNFLSHAGAVSLAGIAATLASVKDVQAADYKALVVVFLSGGFDGNNVLVPMDAAYSDYAKARPSLVLPKDSLVRLSGSHKKGWPSLPMQVLWYNPPPLTNSETNPSNCPPFSALILNKSSGYRVGWAMKTLAAGAVAPWM